MLSTSMHIIIRSRLVDLWREQRKSKTGLLLWYKLANFAKWQNFVELKQVFPSADQVGNLTVFNIGGNKYRLITFIDYSYQKIFIRDVLTHQEYDKNNWKKDTWF
ncbi:MAG: type II toxin-antitoxin system HigB family toxin [Limnothrix sp.]